MIVIILNVLVGTWQCLFVLILSFGSPLYVNS